jgi:hypothetical protein
VSVTATTPAAVDGRVDGRLLLLRQARSGLETRDVDAALFHEMQRADEHGAAVDAGIDASSGSQSSRVSV